jgi:hypothetical protein
VVSQYYINLAKDMPSNIDIAFDVKNLEHIIIIQLLPIRWLEIDRNNYKVQEDLIKNWDLHQKHPPIFQTVITLTAIHIEIEVKDKRDSLLSSHQIEKKIQIKYVYLWYIPLFLL